jgi:hypothetical protein
MRTPGTRSFAQSASVPLPAVVEAGLLEKALLEGSLTRRSPDENVKKRRQQVKSDRGQIVGRARRGHAAEATSRVGLAP